MVVGIADMKMAQYEGMLVTYALGSCIGICLYDPGLRLAALVHVMLPLNMETGRRSPMKYADTGIRETLRQMEARGARRSRMVAKIAGGARMFEVAGGGSLGNIGQRNIESEATTRYYWKQGQMRSKLWSLPLTGISMGSMWQRCGRS